MVFKTTDQIFYDESNIRGQMMRYNANKLSFNLGVLGLAKKFNTEKYINALILTNLIIFVAATTLIIVLSNLIINQNVGLSSYAFTSLFVGYGQIAFNILPILYVVVHSTIVREIAFSKTMSEKQTTQNNVK